MNRSPRDTSKQIAVIGASGDIATENQLALAHQLGIAIATCGLTCMVGGDDGVMGAAARSARIAGGDVVAVLARDKEIKDPAVFTALIDTGLGWVQFSDVLLRSTRGAIAIGGGAGTLAELVIAYFHAVPVVMLGSDSALAKRYGGQSLDERELTQLAVEDEPQAALALLLRSSKPRHG